MSVSVATTSCASARRNRASGDEPATESRAALPSVPTRRLSASSSRPALASAYPGAGPSAEELVALTRRRKSGPWRVRRRSSRLAPPLTRIVSVPVSKPPASASVPIVVVSMRSRYRSERGAGVGETPAMSRSAKTTAASAVASPRDVEPRGCAARIPQRRALSSGRMLASRGVADALRLPSLPSCSTRAFDPAAGDLRQPAPRAVRRRRRRAETAKQRAYLRWAGVSPGLGRKNSRALHGIMPADAQQFGVVVARSPAS